MRYLILFISLLNLQASTVIVIEDSPEEVEIILEQPETEILPLEESA